MIHNGVARSATITPLPLAGGKGLRSEDRSGRTPRAEPSDWKSGGADRDRTGDPLLAKQVLSQLSYSPVASRGHRAPLSCASRPGSRHARNGCAARPTKAIQPGVNTGGIGPAPASRSLRAQNASSGQVSCVGARRRSDHSKGGDPAAPSDTATLLRLHPSHEPHRGRRPPRG